jgi:hypothetical protein
MEVSRQANRTGSPHRKRSSFAFSFLLFSFSFSFSFCFSFYFFPRFRPPVLVLILAQDLSASVSSPCSLVVLLFTLLIDLVLFPFLLLVHRLPSLFLVVFLVLVAFLLLVRVYIYIVCVGKRQVLVKWCGQFKPTWEPSDQWANEDILPTTSKHRAMIKRAYKM